ncbi:MAG TPA: DUF6152 family protein [Bryobacteraceae bacterium]
MRWFAIFGILIAAALVFAQNGFSGACDSTREVTLKGSVTRIEWTNPHAFILVNVQDALGVLTSWARPNLRTLSYEATIDDQGAYQPLVGAMDHYSDHGIQMDSGRRNVRVHLPGRRPVRAF